MDFPFAPHDDDDEEKRGKVINLGRHWTLLFPRHEVDKKCSDLVFSLPLRFFGEFTRNLKILWEGTKKMLEVFKIP
jgi:hypothetical protein